MMKKNIILYSIVSLSILSFQSCANSEDETLSVASPVVPNSLASRNSNAPVIQKSYDVNFSSLQISAIDTEVVKSDVQKVVVSAPKDVMDKIIVENAGDNLHIYVKSANTQGNTYTQGIVIVDGVIVNGGSSVVNLKNVKVTVYAKNINKVKATASAKVNVVDPFVSNTLDLVASSSATISGTFEASFLNIDASSSADISIGGTAKNAYIKNSSSADVNAKNFISQNADIKAGSASNVNLGVSVKVKAIASSSAQINIYQKASSIQKQTSVNSAGKIRFY